MTPTGVREVAEIAVPSETTQQAASQSVAPYARLGGLSPKQSMRDRSRR